MRRNQDAAKIGEVSFNFNKEDMTEEEEKNYGPIAKWIDIGLVMLGVSAGYRLYTSVKKFLERNF